VYNISTLKKRKEKKEESKKERKKERKKKESKKEQKTAYLYNLTFPYCIHIYHFSLSVDKW
jgi:hypothetical protein